MNNTNNTNETNIRLATIKTFYSEVISDREASEAEALIFKALLNTPNQYYDDFNNSQYEANKIMGSFEYEILAEYEKKVTEGGKII